MHDLAVRSGREFRFISICTGGGGLDRALELAIPDARPVVLVEGEAFAVASLVAQIEGGLMAACPIWSDARTFNGRRFRGQVDGLIGGIPCQPHSHAGQRRGSRDERDLLPEFLRICAQARPCLVVIENVAGFLTARPDQIPGAQRARGALQKLGYTVAGAIVRASDLGLPHERERVFIVGVHDGLADAQLGRRGRRQSARRGSGSALPPDGGVAHPGGAGLQGGRPDGDRRGECETAERSGGAMGDTPGVRRREGRPEPSVRSGRDAAAGDGGQLVHAEGDNGRLHPGQGKERCGTPDAGGRGQVVHALGGGHYGRPENALGIAPGRDAEQQHGALCDGQHMAHANGGEPPSIGRDAGEVRSLQEGEGGTDDGSSLFGGSRPWLRPPGPGAADAWRYVADTAPHLLPALSRYDRFRFAMRAQGLAPDGDPSSGAWVDAETGEPVSAARVSAAAQSCVRGMDDGVAARIDELRLLGNGVVPIQGAAAILACAKELAALGRPELWDISIKNRVRSAG